MFFSVDEIGGATRVGSVERCIFCSSPCLRRALESSCGRERIIQRLVFYRRYYETHCYIYNSVMMLLPDDVRVLFHLTVIQRVSCAGMMVCCFFF